ncbi:hypothetical protein DFH11DRAFT_1542736 [Phellopilus nigrolimitatus]|nr:hypothetical protein DFH11DRAFT_1542736 [Phellopilus nigrolimitatus]
MSSPLAPLSFAPSSSPGPTSPVAEVQARRRSQFKSRASSSRVVSSPVRSSRRVGPIPFALGPANSQPAAETGQAAFLRERFKANCFERARRAREKGVQRRRASTGGASSDGFDADMDMNEENEEDDDGGFDDELFRRVVANEKRKRAHAYALSYEIDVGSSFDPNIEDVAEWEDDLRSPSPNNTPTRSQTSRLQNSSYQEEEPIPPDDFDDLAFDEFDDFDGEDNSWVDEYIATLPDEVLLGIQDDPEVAATQTFQASTGASVHTSANDMEDVVME